MRKIFGIAILAGALSTAAFARTNTCESNRGWGPQSDSCSAPSPTPAPEIDPASLMTALTLLGGTLAVMRGRQQKNK